MAAVASPPQSGRFDLCSADPGSAHPRSDRRLQGLPPPGAGGAAPGARDDPLARLRLPDRDDLPLRAPRLPHRGGAHRLRRPPRGDVQDEPAHRHRGVVGRVGPAPEPGVSATPQTGTASEPACETKRDDHGHGAGVAAALPGHPCSGSQRALVPAGRSIAATCIPEPKRDQSPHEALSRRHTCRGAHPERFPATPGNEPDVQCTAALRRLGFPARGSAGGDHPGSSGACAGTACTPECRQRRPVQHSHGGDPGGSTPRRPCATGARAEQSAHGASLLPGGVDPPHGAVGRLHGQAQA